MGDDGVTVDAELVALGLAAEDRVVVEHETATAALFLEEHRRREPADPATDAHQIVQLARVIGARDGALKISVAQAMPHRHDVVSVAVGAGVVPDAAVPVPRIGRRDRGRHLCTRAEHQARAREERAVQEIAARDRRVHPEAIVTHGRGMLASRP